MQRLTLRQRLILGGILVMSAGLNLWHIDFPPGFHADERKKAYFVREGMQDFRHPILLVQSVRVANAVAGFTENDSVVVLGRVVLASAAVGTVLLMFLIARRLIGVDWALIVAAAVAVSPLLVIHAHYLKEDSLLTLTLLASTLAFFRFVDTAGWRPMAVLGIAVGFTLSAHYKSAVLLPMLALAPLFGALRGSSGVSRPLAYYRRLTGALSIAALVWIGINWPALADPARFLDGASYELRHAVEGHDVPIRWNDFWMGFHVIYSLIPGMTWPAVIASAIGLGLTLAGWRHAVFAHRFLAIFALLYYIVPEVSPLKPAPDYPRYVMPAVPVLTYFGCVLFRRLSDRSLQLWAAAAALVVMIAVPAYRCVTLVRDMAADTRTRAAAWVQEQGGQALIEQYAGARSDIWSAAEIDLDATKRDGVRFVVTSSFMFERYALGARLPDQGEATYKNAAGYRELFKRPYIEFTAPSGSFGFNNPTIRIVRLD